MSICLGVFVFIVIELLCVVVIIFGYLGVYFSRGVNGRVILGIGLGIRIFVGNWFSLSIDRGIIKRFILSIKFI